MTPRITSDQDGVTCACPHCDTAGKIHKRHGINTTVGNPADAFVCYNCHTSFNQLTERESHSKDTPDARGGLARELWEMDPEDAGLSPLGSAKPKGENSV